MKKNLFFYDFFTDKCYAECIKPRKMNTEIASPTLGSAPEGARRLAMTGNIK